MLEVISPGLLTSIQDTRGRPEFQRYGVPLGGALDPFAAAAANALVGNTAEAALLEATLAGPTLRFAVSTAFALAGADLSASLDGQPIAPGWSWLARAGSTLSFSDRRAGARVYVAFAGGLTVPLVLGSRATDLHAGFGGLAGRPLRAADRLPIETSVDAVSRCGWHLAAAAWAPEARQRQVRVLPGPHLDRFVGDAFGQLCAEPWEISTQSDRMGYRLEGTPLRHTHRADVASLGLPLGAIQVPGDGQPIVLLADHQPTGGYTVVACVVRADLSLLAQRAPGEVVRFRATSMAEARAALAAQDLALQAIERDETVWVGLRWAESGSLALGLDTPGFP